MNRKSSANASEFIQDSSEPNSREARWHARLALEFTNRTGRTLLARREHDGPLLVQKPLYAEGEAVCQAIIVHPPGGIAGGDQLELCASVGPAAHALLTTPGAAKWYRSSGPEATQKITFDLDDAAALEWLPNETIVFNRARAQQRFRVRMSAEAHYIGWEVLCLGRVGAGERLTEGNWQGRTLIERDGKPLFLERSALVGGETALSSPAVLADHSVIGTLIAVSPGLKPDVLDLCRQASPLAGSAAVTLLPHALVGRYLGESSEAAKKYFIELWRVLRPALLGRNVVEPRIWRT